MAITTFRVIEDEAPLEGALVIAGQIGEQGYTTNAAGEITADLEEDFAVIVNVTIRKDGRHRHTSSPLLIEAGGTYIFDVTHTK